MRFNAYPSPRDYREYLEARTMPAAELQDLIKKSVEEAEKLVDEVIFPQVRITRRILGKETLVLPDFPVHNVEIEELPPNLYQVDESRGVIYVQGYGVAYTVSYYVGYKDGNLPAYLVLLINKLIQVALKRADAEWKSDVDAMALTGKLARGRVEKERNGIETLRESVSQGLPGNSLSRHPL